MKPRHSSSKRGIKVRSKSKPAENRRKNSATPPRRGGASRKSGSTAGKVQIKRAYDSPSHNDGTRILIDRLWPRGLKRSAMALDAWLKDVAPTDALRHWFHDDPEQRWKEFQDRYRAELKSHPEPLQTLREAMRHSPVTLVYGARDPEKNNAVVLRDFLLAHRK